MIEFLLTVIVLYLLAPYILAAIMLVWFMVCVAFIYLVMMPIAFLVNLGTKRTPKRF